MPATSAGARRGEATDLRLRPRDRRPARQHGHKPRLPRLRTRADHPHRRTRPGGDAREPCPFCLELILPGARKCPFCQEYLDASIAPQPEQQAEAPEPQAPKTRTSGLALASLALGIAAPFLCFLTAPPAIFLGVAGYLATRNPRVRGRATAIAGLLLGLLWVAAGVGFLLLMSQIKGTMPGDLGPPTDPYLF